VLALPKKKKRVEVKHKDMAKAAKSLKPKVRDAIKAAQVNKVAVDLAPVQHMMTAQHNFINLDPRSKKTKASKLMVLASNKVEDQVVADQQKQPQWKMPKLSSSSSLGNCQPSLLQIPAITPSDFQCATWPSLI
jgi:hypothetical protein